MAFLLFSPGLQANRPFISNFRVYLEYTLPSPLARRSRQIFRVEKNPGCRALRLTDCGFSVSLEYLPGVWR